MKNTENALNSILLELFKEKVNEVYKDICDKIDKFDKDIIIVYNLFFQLFILLLLNNIHKIKLLINFF